jgi:hypothetical protein
VTDLTVEALAVHNYGRQLAAEGATDEEWAEYRRWRDKVLTTAGDHELASTSV